MPTKKVFCSKIVLFGRVEFIICTNISMRTTHSQQLCASFIFLGTRLERGLEEWDASSNTVLDDLPESEYEEDATVYEITAISKRLKNIGFLKYIPVFPNFDPNVYKNIKWLNSLCNVFKCKGKCKCCRHKESDR